MKKNRLKMLVATVVGTVAFIAAQTSAYACISWFIYEPKMPESLVKED